MQKKKLKIPTKKRRREFIAKLANCLHRIDTAMKQAAMLQGRKRGPNKNSKRVPE